MLICSAPCYRVNYWPHISLDLEKEYMTHEEIMGIALLYLIAAILLQRIIVSTGDVFYTRIIPGK